MDNSPFDSIYYIEGKYFDPYEVLRIAESTPKDKLEEVVSELKERGFTTNKKVREFVNKFEYFKNMSS